jgi:hypothetical protein
LALGVIVYLVFRPHPLQMVAKELGFDYRKGWFEPKRMLGTYQGVLFDIRGGGTSLVFRAQLGEQTPDGLVVIPERVIRSQRYNAVLPELNAAVRSQEVGLPYLEEAFTIWGDDNEQIRRYLSRPGVEDLLLELGASSDWMYIKDGELVYGEPGTGEHAFEYDEPLERLAEAVRVLDGREV